jgi:type II secretion system protein N
MTPRRFAPSGRKALAAYFAVGLAVFVLFLVASFPYNATMSSMLAPYHLRLTYDRQRISLPLGAKLFNVSLVPTLPGQGDALLQSPEVTLAPTLSALLLGRPGLRVTARLYDGMVRVALRQQLHGATDIAFQLDAINPARCAPLTALGAIIEGRVTAAGTARIVSPSVADNSAQMTIQGHGVVLTLVNGFGFPPMALGDVSGMLRLDQGTLALDQIHVANGDAAIDGSGTIQLGQSLADSTIELNFTLIPTPAGRDHLGFFLQALPHHEDSATPYNLSGPLLAPRLS